MTFLSVNFRRVQNQIFVTILTNIILFSCGSTVGWFATSLPILRGPNTPLDIPLDIADIGWIGSVLSLGAMTSSLLFGTIINRLGLKRSILLNALPLAGCWLCLIFGTHPLHILASRVLSGMAAGGVFVSIPQFVAELADDFIRGQLNAYMMMFLYIGVLFGFVGGAYVDYYTNLWIWFMVPVVFVCCFVFVPETPQYLLRTNKIAAAEKSIRFYRNCRKGHATESEESRLQEEFTKFQAIAKQNQEAPTLNWSDFCTRPALRAFTTIPCLIIFNALSGSFILNNYAATIFMETGSTIDANDSTIIMGSVQVLGTYAASQLIDRVGRRVLLLISSSGSAISLATTGVFVYMVRHGYDISEYSFVPVASLSFFIFISAIGIIPLPFIVMAEMLPAKIRKSGASLCVCFSFILQFIGLKTFPYLNATIDLYGCMCIFTVVTTCGFFFGLFVLKETKGKNLDVLEETKTQNNV